MGLTIDQLTGGYGNLNVLNEVSLEVNDGALVALIGLNGAGKSTTIKHIIGLLQPKSGTITIDGHSITDEDDLYRQSLAYVPETPVLYPELTLREHLELTMSAYGLDPKTTWPISNEMLEKFRLDNKLDWFPANFSKGMQQKVMIVAAFMTNARVFIIDEPFTGLDPIAVRDLIALIEAKKLAGAAILMTTHILSTAQQYADSLVLLKDGRVRAQGSLEDLAAAFNLETTRLDDIYLAMAEEGATR